MGIRVVLDGEEEIGSPSLRALLRERRLDLASDAAVISDTRMLGPGRPTITVGLRGSLSMELEVRGAQRDLHSGNFGGAVDNPGEAIAAIVAGLHDASGRVSASGFYDSVRVLSMSDRARLARSAPSDADVERSAGIERGRGESGYSAYERTTIRPALVVTGLSAGHHGPGAKAVIPARAVAKLNARLVPDQDPATVERLLRAHIRRTVRPTVAWRLTTLAAARPVLVRAHSPALTAAARACERAFGVAPALIRSGGTIPVVADLVERLRVPTVLMGFALPDSRLHAPNENLHLPTFFQGIDACIWFMHELGNLGSARRPTAERRVGWRRPMSSRLDGARRRGASDPVEVHAGRNDP